jgi:fused signal recognition particle receptor
MKWFDKVKNSFSAATNKITSVVSDFINKKHLDDASLAELEELLLKADIGVAITTKVISKIKQLKFDKQLDPQKIKDEIAKFIADSFDKSLPTQIQLQDGITVILVCGVNGNGKTTTIGKMAHYYKQQNKKVVLAACDTFRAAATEQLEHWADTNQVTIVTGDKIGAEPASVAYKALMQAKELKADLLIIDTAGRLNNNKNLMEQLVKIKKVLAKIEPSAPHYCLLVLDATTGQNAVSQVSDFKNSMEDLNGLVVTKMDSTAKAGTVINIIEKFKIPVYFIGTGEKINDLENFDSAKFAYNLLK